jgi:hypothetical protein
VRELAPAFQSGGKPPHSKDQGKRTLVQTFSNVALIFNDLWNITPSTTAHYFGNEIAKAAGTCQALPLKQRKNRIMGGASCALTK